MTIEEYDQSFYFGLVVWSLSIVKMGKNDDVSYQKADLKEMLSSSLDITCLNIELCSIDIPFRMRYSLIDP